MPIEWKDKSNPPKRPPPPTVYLDTSIDDWQRKINDDFNQLYSSLYKNAGDFGMSSFLNPKEDGLGVNQTISHNHPNPERLVVPEVIVTAVKDKRTLEKIDNIERTEQIFDEPIEQTHEYCFDNPFRGEGNLRKNTSIDRNTKSKKNHTKSY